MWDEMVNFAEREQQLYNDDKQDEMHIEDSAAPTPPASTFEDFLQIVERGIMRTTVALVSFTPERITIEDFSHLMEHILA